MDIQYINAPHARPPSGGYTHVVSVSDVTRTVYVSGQIPVTRDGTVPDTFTAQAELAWANIEAHLRAAGMGLENIVKHTTYLSDRAYRADNEAVRRKVLGDHQPALTIIIADIYDEVWLLEIEAIAVQ